MCNCLMRIRETDNKFFISSPLSMCVDDFIELAKIEYPPYHILLKYNAKTADVKTCIRRLSIVF